MWMDEDTKGGREMLEAGGTKRGYGGDGDGVMEGTKHRKRIQAGTEGWM